MRWTGFSERDDTWEPRAHLSHDLIEDFREAQKKKQRLFTLNVLMSFHFSPCRSRQAAPPNLAASLVSTAPTLKSPLLQSWDDVAPCPPSLLPPCLQYSSVSRSKDDRCHESRGNGCPKPFPLPSAFERTHAQPTAHHVSSTCHKHAHENICSARRRSAVVLAAAATRPASMPQPPAARSLMKQQHPKKSIFANVKLQKS